MNHKTILARASVVAAGALAPWAVLAQTNPFQRAGSYVNQVGTGAGIGGAGATPLPVIIGNIINVALGFLGIVLLFYLLYGGFTWMTAGGDSKKVDTAKQMITNAIIGLIIIVASFAISNFVLTSLVNVAGT